MRPGFYVCTHKLDRGTGKKVLGDRVQMQECSPFPVD